MSRTLRTEDNQALSVSRWTPVHYLDVSQDVQNAKLEAVVSQVLLSDVVLECEYRVLIH